MGAGAAGFLYFHYPALFGNASFFTVIGIGAGIGGGLQKLINKAVKSILHPLSKNDDYYEKLEELRILRATNQISETQYKDIVAKLTEKRFLGISTTTSVSKEPPTSIIINPSKE